MHKPAWLATGTCLLSILGCTHEPRRESLTHGRFEHLQLSVPDKAQSTVLLLAGAADQALADSLSAQASKENAVIIRIDAAEFQRVLEATPEGCVFPSGDLDNLSRFVQAYAKLPSYEPPILLGLGVGASLAVDALTQAPANGFAGAIVFDYCGASGLRARLCPRNGSEAAPAPTQTLVRLRSTASSTCPPGTPAAYAEPGADVGSFRAAFTTLAASAQARAVTAPTSMSDLPIIEVDANAQGVPDTFGVFLSGDGGWAGFDEKLSALLAERGLPIVGLDSLRYFWAARTPESTTADLDRIIRHYQAAWKRRRIALIGFSQGADVLPFVLNRLPPATRGSIVSSVAMSISFKASFEFHLSNWLGASGEELTLPEMQRLPQSAVVYVCGTADGDAICPQLDPAAFQIISLPGSHHFNDDYERLSSIVLDSLANR